MRVALIGDTQVDEHADLESQVRTLRFIADEIARRGCDLALHSGDVFERRSTPRERRVMADHVQAVAETCPYAIVAGNHDAPEDVAWLSRLRGRHSIVARERPGVETIGGALVAFLPWPSTSALRAWIGDVASAESLDTTARDMLAALCRGLGAQLDEAEQHEPLPRILLGHIMPAEGRSSTGQPLCGAELRIGDAELGLARAHLYAFGHLHNGALNEWSIDGRPALMPGSTRRRDFGEIEPKRMVVFDLAADGTVLSREDVPLPVPPMAHAEATWVGGETRWTWTESPPTVAACGGALIRFRWHASPLDMPAARLAAESLRSAWIAHGAAVVKLDPVPLVETRARAPEVAAAVGVEAKWRTLQTMRGTNLCGPLAEDVVERRAALLREVESEVA